MKGLAAAVRFLTILPLPGRASQDDIAASLVFFPVVGLAIGLAAAGVARLLPQIMAPLPAAALIMLLLLGISGGLHMDGLADTADGLLSSRPRERMLEIMRDSHVGAMAVMAVSGVIVLKTAALASVAAPAALWQAALLMPMAGRCAMPVTIALLPYARPAGGLAAPYYGRPARGAALWAATSLLVVAALVAGWLGVAVAGATLAATLAMAAWCRRRLGGATGDTIGATCEVVETLAAVLFAMPPLVERLA